MITEFRGDYQCLSNFHRSRVTLYSDIHQGLEVFEVPAEGLAGPTVEHVFQAVKTLDVSARRNVLSASTPSEAKRRGRRVPLMDDWDNLRVKAMFAIVKSKFLQNPDLLEVLISTGDKELYEGTTWGDRVWGIDLAEYRQTGRIVGHNYLGQILMRLRSDLS